MDGEKIFILIYLPRVFHKLMWGNQFVEADRSDHICGFGFVLNQTIADQMHDVVSVASPDEGAGKQLNVFVFESFNNQLVIKL